MEQLFTFIGNHPILVATFVVLLILFIRNEMNRGGSNIEPQQLVQMVNAEGAIVVDLRDKAEYDQGHIVDAINIPFSSLESRADELMKYKESPIVLICKMGQHAGSAGIVEQGDSQHD